MIEATPQWTFTGRRRLTQWYGHVHLLPRHVLGQWFCVDRCTGISLWERMFLRPNSVVGVADGVVVASETRSDGPWTADFGCYGISLESGRLLWTSHRNGWWGRFVRLLDFIPGFTNELRDVANRVIDGEVICESGRVLDVRTGRQARRMQRSGLASTWPRTPAQPLYYTESVPDSKGVPLGLNRRLSAKRSEDGQGLAFRADRGGEPLWTFNLNTATGYFTEGYRLAMPYLYIVASEAPNWTRHSTKQHYVVPNPTRFHLLAVELDGGTLVQDVLIADRLLADCRIEDVDEGAVLVSLGERQVSCYKRVPVVTAATERST